MVRLGAYKGAKVIFTQKGFNSSMVRLGGRRNKYLSWRKAEFQFQYGAIGSKFFIACIDCIRLFQFQYGAIGRTNIISADNQYITVSIPVWCDWEIKKKPTKKYFNSFNSSMVRLGES